MIKSNKILPLLIVAIYFLQFAIPAGIFIHFKVYQDEIEETFCVNIDKPEMNCHGQCHMQKQIAKVTVDTKKDKKNSNRTIQVEELIGINNSSLATILEIDEVEYILPIDNSSNQYKSKFLKTEVPPPQV